MRAKIRSFVAIHLPECLKEQIARFQIQLKSLDADIKWIRPENMHLTLKFFGDVSTDQIESIIEKMIDVCRLISPFKMQIQGTGVFPNTHRPRVIWLGITEGQNSLNHMAFVLNDSLKSMGFEPENRDFHPHLTLGRVRSLTHIGPVISAMQEIGFTGDAFTVESIFLMKSDLKHAGPEYTILKTIQL